MLVIGLDAASDWRNFGYAVGRYVAAGPVSVEAAGIIGPAGDPTNLKGVASQALLNERQALIAIDAPLGWPVAHGASLVGHAAGARLDGPKDDLFRRRTDIFVREQTGKMPLEVGADRIARAAFTALEALERLRALTNNPIPLAWNLPFVGIAAIEVYPAATLKARKIPAIKYKERENVEARSRIAEALQDEIVGMSERVKESDDVFDACLCLVAAKDFLDGAALAPSDAQMDLAKKEGWIWVRRATG